MLFYNLNIIKRKSTIKTPTSWQPIGIFLTSENELLLIVYILSFLAS